jgi:cobalamin biosynthesis Mg chelatase CobN
MKTMGLSERKPIEINSNRKLFSSGGLLSDRVHPSGKIVAKVEKRNLTVMLNKKYDEAKIDYAKTLQPNQRSKLYVVEERTSKSKSHVYDSSKLKRRQSIYSEQQQNNTSVKDFKFSINKIKTERKLTWTDYSMLYHVIAKVLFLFIVFMIIYMMFIYNRI